MKKFFSIATSALALAAAAPAFAAPAVNIDLTGVGVQQTSVASVNQTGVAIDLAIGSVTNSNIDSTAVNGNNMASVDATINQASWLGNLAADVVGVVQTSVAGVTQGALAITGSGSLNGSNSSALAANLNNQAGVTVSVTQH